MTFMMTGDNGDIAKTLQPLHIYPLFWIDDMHETRLRSYRLSSTNQPLISGKNFDADFHLIFWYYSLKIENLHVSLLTMFNNIPL